MNYIQQLNLVFKEFSEDDRLNPTHISLYISFFQVWHASGFAAEFFVKRRELMQMAKIGSKSTYHRCVTDLDRWNYLTYFPCNNPYQGSKIRMIHRVEREDQHYVHYDTRLEQLADGYYNLAKQTDRPYRALDKQTDRAYRALDKQTTNMKVPQPNELPDILNFFNDINLSADVENTIFKYSKELQGPTSEALDIRDWFTLFIHCLKKISHSGLKKEGNHRINSV
ncbi:hypothetical protein DET49_10338 [Salegentibacter sp. 24]|uniref:hypothetical protein n=1 Tax=Salegentibacter sp. 24 TaxID=2183986 RepID=UPI00105B90FC|nr:hypothetical protein [Salegentibacter sp. 24]TDN94972.1 hypothetical protein DET49_10338 [Salegentibacter sp. 24]